MKNPISMLFWRIILPLVLASLLAFAGLIALAGYTPRGFYPFSTYIGHLQARLFLAAILFCMLFVLGLLKTLRWGKEAEDFEAELKAEEKPEAEHRR